MLEWQSLNHSMSLTLASYPSIDLSYRFASSLFALLIHGQRNCQWGKSDRGGIERREISHVLTASCFDVSIDPWTKPFVEKIIARYVLLFPLTISINNVAIRIPSWIVAQPQQLVKCSIKSSILDPHLLSCLRIRHLHRHHLQPSLPIVDDK